MSIGTSPFYTLGITYLTGHLNNDDQPIYTKDRVFEGSYENSCLFLLTYFETLMATPHLINILRSVRHELQSFSLGFENCIVKLLAQISTPILFGIILDNQCLFWSQSTFHHRASCFIYNGDKLPMRLFATTIIIKLISFIFILILFLIKFRENKFLLIQ
ncbi:unnamed protein product [Rotaria magnacalcarata]|nr:unnamed protein product [Rotaria magnacalcarata]CAF2132395.1 unnamed protein product [Rotaria magnacalcarata]